jgi:hypothetical protein
LKRVRSDHREIPAQKAGDALQIRRQIGKAVGDVVGAPGQELEIIAIA